MRESGLDDKCSTNGQNHSTVNHLLSFCEIHILYCRVQYTKMRTWSLNLHTEKNTENFLKFLLRVE